MVAKLGKTYKKTLIYLILIWIF